MRHPEIVKFFVALLNYGNPVTQYLDCNIPCSPAPPPAPQSVMMEVTSPSSLTVNWTAPSDTSNVRGYMFTVTGEDCGDCVNTTVSADTTSVSCSDYMVDGQTCSFGVTTVSQDCGFTNDTAATAFVVLSGEIHVYTDMCSFRVEIYIYSLFSSLPSVQCRPNVLTGYLHVSKCIAQLDGKCQKVSMCK